MDANLTTPSIRSLAELSLSPVFRRGWPSTYEAVQDGEVPGKELMHLFCTQMPNGGTVILAGDHTAWPCPQARTLADRTIEHQPTSVPGNRPITVGHGYSTLAWVPDTEGSWALPLLHERISSTESPIPKATAQLREVCTALPKATSRVALYDSEYGCDLGREVLEDKPLPWQANVEKMTPGRSCQAWGSLLARIGTPAAESKPRGKSPGWPEGRVRKRREVHPVVKKADKRQKTATTTAK